MNKAVCYECGIIDDRRKMVEVVGKAIHYPQFGSGLCLVCYESLSRMPPWWFFHADGRPYWWNPNLITLLSDYHTRRAYTVCDKCGIGNNCILPDSNNTTCN